MDDGRSLLDRSHGHQQTRIGTAKANGSGAIAKAMAPPAPLASTFACRGQHPAAAFAGVRRINRKSAHILRVRVHLGTAQ